MNNRVRRAKERARQEKRKKIMRKVYCISGVGAIILTILVVVASYNYKLNIGNRLVDWDKIEYDIGDVDVVEPLGGTVTQSSYHKVRMAASARTLSKLRNILPIEVYDNLIKGVQSKYYMDVVHSEYVETVKEVRDMMAQSEYILKMYDDYSSLEGFKDFEGCHTEDCVLKEFIDSYTGNDLHRYFSEVHQKWESLIEYQIQRVEVDDNTLAMFYQEEITTNMDYIEDIDVTVYIINDKLHNLNDADWVETLREKGKIPTKKIDESDKESLEMLSLYRSDKFYDANIAGLAAPTLMRILDTSANSNSKVINLSDVEDLEQAIRDIKPPTDSDGRTKIMDLPYITYSLVERSTEDIIHVYYDIESIKHIENMPTIDDLRYELQYKAKVYLAEADIAAELDRRIKDDVGEEYGIGTTPEESHDHDGDGVEDHIYDEETGEWLIYDGHGNYIRETAVDHDHDGDGLPDH